MASSGAPPSFDSVLDGLLNADNAVRTQAEAYYSQLAYATDSSAGDVRNACALLTSFTLIANVNILGRSRRP